MVKIVNLFSVVMEVDADNEGDARIEAHKEYTKNPENHRRAFYEATLPPDQWSVITKEKYEELKAQIETKVLEQNEGGEGDQGSPGGGR